MVLIRRYHFEGVAYGLVLVTVLFLWRQSVPLVPVPPSATGNMAGGVISGKDSRHGLVNLLRRNIAPRDILSTCAAEWRRSGGANSIERSEQMESILAAMSSTAASEELVSVYRKLCEANTAGRPAKIYASQS